MIVVHNPQPRLSIPDMTKNLTLTTMKNQVRVANPQGLKAKAFLYDTLSRRILRFLRQRRRHITHGIIRSVSLTL
jgi:hypothetical protein